MASAFREFNDRAGTLGVVYAAAVHNGRLYLGTNQGLFQKTMTSGSSFSLVPGTEGQVWTIKVIGESLFCGHDRGTFLVGGEDARLISDQAGTWDIQAIPGSDTLLMQGTYQGLGVLRKAGSSWAFRNAIEGFDISSRFFQFTGSGHVLINHEYKGIYDLKLDDSLLQVVDSAQTPPWGVGASLFKYQGALLYANDNGLFRYVPSRAQFQPDSTLNTALIRASDRPLGVLISDTAESRLWGLGSKSILYFEPQTLGGGYELNSIPVPEDFRNTLGVLGFECLTPLGNERYLIGRSNGYLTMDLTRLSLIEPEVFIHRLGQRFYKGAAEPLPLNEGLNIEYDRNNLEFAYHVTEFDKYTEVEYQYRLDGLQDQWSIWTTESSVSFENLPYGDYRFEVRARIGDRSSEASQSFSFRINRPWYLSYQALAIYVLMLLLISLLVHRQYKSYYRRQQEKVLEANRKKQKRKNLKAKKKIVEMRNTQLSKEIESKNRELAVSTMSLIRKNEFLNTLKKELLAIDDSKKIKDVIKTIDRSINNEADWEFFQEAFNNADKDFLKAIKRKHPELTPNDLKLCAYLRLNLSSKEIAPLLNISVRSVEVKRYRLRKKINLPHEKGLTEYILAL
jgi:DNA-binding CsgD family transcriptional regulator